MWNSIHPHIHYKCGKDYTPLSLPCDITKYLSENNIQARLFWNALSLQTPYKKYIKHLNGVSHRLSGTIISIPCSSSLKEKDQMKVIKLIMNWKGTEITDSYI